MIITFDHITDDSGNVIVTHFIDTDNPAVQTMLTALKDSPVARETAGYGSMTSMSAYSGKTRWEAILGEVVRLNDTVARPLLGV